jgi:nucleoid-associated protein YgaU
VESQTPSPELADREKDVVQQLHRYREPVSFVFSVPDSVDTTVRTELPLPRATPQIAEQVEDVIKEVESQKTVEVSNASILQKREALRRQNQPKVYTVEEGDNLAKIAKRFYGNELGNRVSTIQALFEANRKMLRSMDDVMAGQELVIPKLNTASIKTLAEVTQPVRSVGTPEPVEKKKVVRAKPQYYVVKEDDTLWDIASSMLGRGSRYTEIARLNALRDEDTIKAGMKLRLPTH